MGGPRVLVWILIATTGHQKSTKVFEANASFGRSGKNRYSWPNGKDVLFCRVTVKLAGLGEIHFGASPASKKRGPLSTASGKKGRSGFELVIHVR